MEMKKLGLGTTAIHAGTLKNLYGTLAMPIYQTSTLYLIQQNKGEEDLPLKKLDIFTQDLEILQQQHWKTKLLLLKKEKLE